jgi:hypothetical protein
VTLDEFFAGNAHARQLFEALQAAAKAVAGPVELQVSKSQVALRHPDGGKPLAWAWVPARYLGEGRGFAPLVVSLVFSARDPSPRWKEIVEPSRGRFMHHLELRDAAEIDAEVQAWIIAATQAAADRAGG